MEEKRERQKPWPWLEQAIDLNSMGSRCSIIEDVLRHYLDREPTEEDKRLITLNRQELYYRKACGDVKLGLIRQKIEYEKSTQNHRIYVTFTPAVFQES